MSNHYKCVNRDQETTICPHWMIQPNHQMWYLKLSYQIRWILHVSNNSFLILYGGRSYEISNMNFFPTYPTCYMMRYYFLLYIIVLI